MSKELFFEQKENENSEVVKLKFNLENVLVAIKNQAIEGSINPLSAFIKFTEYEKLLKELKDEIKEISVNEAAKFNKSVYGGYNIQLSDRQTMDYTHIKEWNETKKKLKEIEDNAKAVFKITGGSEIVDPETGEVKQSAKIKSVSNVITLEKAK